MKQAMKEDHFIITLLEYKKSKNLRDKLFLWWLKKGYPSYKTNKDIEYILYRKKYLKDISGWVDKRDNNGDWIARPENIPEIFLTTKLGEKAIYSKELKSEKTEDFFDKTIVRWVLVITSLYGIVSFFINLFRYFKN